MRKNSMLAIGLALAAGSAAALIGAPGRESRARADGHATATPARAASPSSPALQLTGGKVAAAPGTISTIAGTGEYGFSGDGGPATQAMLGSPRALSFDGKGNLFVLDNYNWVRRISPAGTIVTHAGTGQYAEFTPRGATPVGDGGPATAAQFNGISGIAADAAGNLFIADARDFRIRKVGTDGIIRTFAGLGEAQGGWNVKGTYSGEGGPAANATLAYPTHMTVDRSGNLFFLDNGFVRKIAANGVITTVAGNGQEGSSGDGGPALHASFDGQSLATDALGNLYILDKSADKVRRVSPAGIITTVAGGGRYVFDADARKVDFVQVGGLAVDAAGNMLVTGGNLVLRTSPAGVLDVVAGKFTYGETLWSTAGFGGDGGPATEAKLAWPTAVAFDAAGNFYIADSENNRIRKVTATPAAATPAAMNSFGAGQLVALTGPPLAIAVADVTGDRRDDLLVITEVDQQASQLQVHVQKADGTLSPPTRSPTIPYPYSLETADFNRDGRADIVVSGANLAVGLGSATGAVQFQVLPRRWRESTPNSPKVVDANRDGWLDIAISESTEGLGVSVYHGNGNGGFAAPIKLITSLQRSTTLRSGDFNADGHVDLVAYDTYAGNPSTHLLLSQDVDRYPTAQTIPAPHLDFAPITGDWNADGRLDLLESRYEFDLGDTFFQLRMQSANGQFAAVPTLIRNYLDSRWAMGTDIDGDGLDDMLSALDGLGVGVHLQRNGALERDVKFPLPDFVNEPAYAAPHLAAGDLNGDGCKDIALQEGGSVAVVYYATRCRPPQVARDLDGDRRADIVWRNMATGANDMWRSGLSSGRVAMTAVADLNWKVVGSGDFDGDGKADLLWRNGATGANDLWRSGSVLLRQAISAETNPAWKVAAVGDFNNDGRDDIFWRNVASGANGVWWSANRATSQAALTLADQNWQVAGVGDFTGDAKDDVLWRNNATGVNELWPSASHAQRRAITAVTSLPWKIAAVADFNGDGDADILWRHASTGANVIWLFGKATTQRAVATVADVNWEVASAADYDGDGKADIVWRHKTSGANELWSEGNVRFRKVLPTVGTAWSVVPQR